MKVGDILHLTPAASGYGSEDLIAAGPWPCRVVYIHPQRRFFIVEFRSKVTGETWRETRYFQDRAGQYKGDSI